MIAPNIYQNVFTGKYEAWSKDPETPHCYGTGNTPETALMSYKLNRRVICKNTV